jgi:hypothetical protein
MCVMVTMMYGSGMPLLYAFASFFCLTIAFFDKRFLLRVCRRPPRYGTDLVNPAALNPATLRPELYTLTPKP